MPAKSSKQYGLMQGILHGSIMPEKGGPSKSVAKEFVKATSSTKRKKFAKQLMHHKKGDKRGNY